MFFEMMRISTANGFSKFGLVFLFISFHCSTSTGMEDKLSINSSGIVSRSHLASNHPEDPVLKHLERIPRSSNNKAQLIMRSNLSSTVVPAGSVVQFTCEALGSLAFKRVNMNLYRHRVGFPAETINRVITLSKLDKEARFFCETTGGNGVITSKIISFDVTFPPRDLELISFPPGLVPESEAKRFSCRFAGGSNPPSKIVWSHYSLSGQEWKAIPNGVAKTIQRNTSNGGTISQSVVNFTAKRHFTGDKIKCTIVYQGRNVLSENSVMNVSFAPNIVQLFSKPIDGVREGNVQEVTCRTGNANPAPKVTWIEIEPGYPRRDVSNQAETTQYVSDKIGFIVNSVLKIKKTFKINSGIAYECRVTHSSLSTPVIKTHRVILLYPPTIRIQMQPEHPVETRRTAITCNVSPDPSVVISWKFKPFLNVHGFLSNVEPEKRIDSGWGEHSSNQLILNSTSRFNSGLYTCEARGRGGLAADSLSLNVLYAPVMLPSTKTLVTATLNSEVNLILHFLAYPLQVTLTWYRVRNVHSNSLVNYQSTDRKVNSFGKRHEKLVLGKHFTAGSLGNTTYILQVHGVTEEDFGEYLCELQHTLGKRTFRFYLKSDDSPKIAPDSLSVEQTGDQAIIRFQPPSSHFTHLVIRACPKKDSLEVDCLEQLVSDPESGSESMRLSEGPSIYKFKLIVYQNHLIADSTDYIDWGHPSASSSTDQSSHIEIALGITMAGGAVFVFLCVVVIILAYTKYKRNTTKQNGIASPAASYASSLRRRTDYILLGNTDPNLLTAAQLAQHNQGESRGSETNSLPSYHQVSLVPRQLESETTLETGSRSSGGGGGSLHHVYPVEGVMVNNQIINGSMVEQMSAGSRVSPQPGHNHSSSSPVTVIQNPQNCGSMPQRSNSVKGGSKVVMLSRRMSNEILPKTEDPRSGVVGGNSSGYHFLHLPYSSPVYTQQSGQTNLPINSHLSYAQSPKLLPSTGYNAAPLPAPMMTSSMYSTHSPPPPVPPILTANHSAAIKTAGLSPPPVLKWTGENVDQYLSSMFREPLNLHSPLGPMPPLPTVLRPAIPRRKDSLPGDLNSIEADADGKEVGLKASSDKKRSEETPC